MTKVLVKDYNHDNDIFINDLDDDIPIFAIENGKIRGMFIHESNGWIIRYPDGCGCSGHHNKREECARSAKSFGLTFCIE